MNVAKKWANLGWRSPLTQSQRDGTEAVPSGNEFGCQIWHLVQKWITSDSRRFVKHHRFDRSSGTASLIRANMYDGLTGSLVRHNGHAPFVDITMCEVSDRIRIDAEKGAHFCLISMVPMNGHNPAIEISDSQHGLFFILFDDDVPVPDTLDDLLSVSN